MKSFFIALQFLTRLKVVNQQEWTMEDFGKSVIAFPYVGLVIGLLLAIIYGIGQYIFPTSTLLLIIVISEFLITGGLHADGLMDTSDGIFSGRDREKMLEIMKDSRVGSFGVVAILFVTLLKWQLLVAVPDYYYLYIILIMMPLMSRFTLVHSICSYPYARKTGMGQAFSEMAPKHVVLKNTIATFFMPFIIGILLGIYFLAASFMTVGNFEALYYVSLPLIATIVMVLTLINTFSMVVTYIINYLLNQYIVKQLGGTTGDTYGFVVEVSEVLLLFVYVIVLSIYMKAI
ncbi:adenosylcobinamide-GDP ribazoletransferase [Veillonella agrestimuris]|uniref:adenosylcobinamide-GDP ribazoletransferase n=1 Tax=Veillonella agrestimuris TaxID=2941340 RepID=UPI002040288F|nr:adenosylcobinamide-GDP ribazoletransferase [Veillonella agrestimuris]